MQSISARSCTRLAKNRSEKLSSGADEGRKSGTGANDCVISQFMKYGSELASFTVTSYPLSLFPMGCAAERIQRNVTIKHKCALRVENEKHG